MRNGINGINGHSGDILDLIFPLELIVRGSTVPLDITLTDNLVTDYTGYKIYLSFDTVLTCVEGHIPDLEIDVPLVSATEGTFFGYLTDDDSFAFSAGNINISLKYIDADERTFIADMAQYKVVNCINPKRA